MPTPKKSLGQNFLQHPQIADRMVRAADVPRGMPVLEIGPGTGILTRALLAAGHRVIAVEADRELVAVLEETFGEAIAGKKLELIHDDIRVFDPKTIGTSYSLVANIPYYITGEIIRTFLTAAHKPISLTLLVQKEVAERIARPKGRVSKESLLSLSVKAYGTPKYCFTVPKGAFFPAPKVDSAVISIQNIRSDAFESPEKEALFFAILRTGFAHKRKLLIRNLEALFPAPKVSGAFEKVAIPDKIRAEDLSLTDWQRLVNVFSLP